jgi:O-antigen/teichoic acid export membrane protein
MKNTLFVFLGQIAVLGGNVCVLVLLARYWDEFLLGNFSYGLVFVGFFTLLGDFGMKPVLVREMSRDRSTAELLVNSAVVVKTVFSGIAVLAACVMARVLMDDFQFKSVALLSLVILFSSKSGAIRVAFESLFQADMELQFPVGFQLLDSLLQVAVVAILVSVKASFLAILAGYVTANIPGCLWTVAAINRRIRFRFKADSKTVRWLLKESFPLFLYLILAMLYERLDVLFLKSFYGDSAVGIYSSAFRLTAPLVFIPYAVVTALYPLMAKTTDHQDSALSHLFGFGLKLLLLIGIGINVAVMVAGKPAFLLLFGSRYSDAVFPFQLLLLSQSIMFLIFFMVDYINARGRQRKNVLYIAAMIPLSFFLQRFFIKSYGMAGAGWSKILLNAVGLAVLFLLVQKGLGRERRAHFLKAGLLLILFLIPACAAFAGKIPSWLTGLVLGAAVLAGSYWLFSREEKRLLNKMFREALAKWGLVEGVPAP